MGRSAARPGFFTQRKDTGMVLSNVIHDVVLILGLFIGLVLGFAVFSGLPMFDVFLIILFTVFTFICVFPFYYLFINTNYYFDCITEY